MPAYRHVLCDVFTERPLAGNPLCVFTDARGLDEATMQALARETNLSETTFLLPAERGGDLRVRIFTPLRELPFAGHPLIGTAVVVARTLPLERLVFETGVGLLPLYLERVDGEVRSAVMEQPSPSLAAHPEPARVCAALGLSERQVTVGDNGVRVGLVEIASVEELAALEPDQAALARIGGLDVVSVYSDGGEVARVRVFCPWAGIAEDPGTGVAAGPLGVHLGRSITISQGIEIGRPSIIEVEVQDGRPPRVSGAVVVVGRGSYLL